MKRRNGMLAALACLAKLALPPAGAQLAAASAPHGWVAAHLSHGRGSAGQFLPDAGRRFVMGAAAEVAMRDGGTQGKPGP